MTDARESNEMDIIYQPIGYIYSPFDDPNGMPLQPPWSKKAQGIIEILPKYSKGLKDLEGFSHIILIYHFHQVRGYNLTLTPFLDTKAHGVFSTRAPKRPNPIGLSVVKLIQIKGKKITIDNVDILNKTPLLDIKPYVPEFDHPEVSSLGWLEQFRVNVHNKKSDARFK